MALSRYGGLRCPSEHVPLFPELRSHLLEAFERAAPGAEFVVTRARCRSTNLRTGLLRIIARAGVSPWPRLFHYLRASWQTELVESFPLHVVCAWLGNTPAVAQGHCLQGARRALRAGGRGL